MSHADDMRQQQLDRQAEAALHHAEFLRHHPEYRNGPPPAEWPGLQDPPKEAA